MSIERNRQSNKLNQLNIFAFDRFDSIEFRLRSTKEFQLIDYIRLASIVDFVQLTSSGNICISILKEKETKVFA